MKIIGLDVGTKRIGVAKVDSTVKIALRCGTVEVDGTEFEQIARIARVTGTDFFVLGLPRSNEGNETQQSEYVKNFAKELKKHIPTAKINFQDESLTSVEAESRLKTSKKSYEKGDIDAEAATIILQDFIENYSQKKITNSTTKPAKPSKKMTKKKSSRKLIRTIALSAIGAIIVFCTVAYLWYESALAPTMSDCKKEDADTAVCEENFLITANSSISSIADDLKESNFIKSSLAFKIYYKLHHSNEFIRTGEVVLNKSMSTPEIVEALINSTKDDGVFSFTFLPGETIMDFRAKLAEYGYTYEEIDAALAKNYDHPVLSTKPAEASLEGYLFGETYEFYKNETVENIITTMLDQLYLIVQENNITESLSARGLTLHQGIILASIVQKESPAADRPTVAQVFLLRLSYGIPLGSDITVKYALDLVDPDRTTYTDNASALQIDSCYNTRLYAGLPCGAVSSPSENALMAVAHPSDTTYLYFLTGDDNMMYYSYTDSEHIQKIQLYCKELCNTEL